MIRFPPFKVIYKKKNSKMIEYKSVPLYLSTRPRTKKLYNSVIDMISENKIKELEEKLAGFQKKREKLLVYKFVDGHSVLHEKNKTSSSCSLANVVNDYVDDMEHIFEENVKELYSTKKLTSKEEKNKLKKRIKSFVRMQLVNPIFGGWLRRLCRDNTTSRMQCSRYNDYPDESGEQWCSMGKAIVTLKEMGHMDVLLVLLGSVVNRKVIFSEVTGPSDWDFETGEGFGPSETSLIFSFNRCRGSCEENPK